MAGLSDYAVNKIIDHVFRGQTYSPPASLYIALFTAAPSKAGGGTEVTGGSYARVAVTSSLANWAGTQAAGSTLASSGTAGVTSNNGTVTFPSPTANWGTIVAVGIMDASTSGNLIAWGPLSSSKTVNNGDAAPSFAAGSLTFSVATGGFTDFLENTLIDWLFRAQAFAAPTNLYFGLFTAAPSDTGGGTEVSTSGTNYSRATIACSLANWAGTQAAGSTLASSGTSGVTSNNGSITMPAPSGSAWSTAGTPCTDWGLFDAASAGHLLIYGALAASKVIGATDPAPVSAAGATTVTIVST